MTLCGDVDDVGIRRMNQNTWNMMRILQAHIGPRLSAIHRFVDAVAPRRALAIVAFSGSHPDNIRFRLRYGYVADGGNPLIVKHRRPGNSPVDTFKNSAAGGSRVDDVGVAFDHREIVGASTGVGGSDLAKFQRL